MVKVDDWGDPQLIEAVLIWTGYRDRTTPCWDNSLLEQRFGADATRWLTLLESLADDFYASNAKYDAPDLQEMGVVAIRDFMQKHPDAPEEIAEAFAWCYTFDHR